MVRAVPQPLPLTTRLWFAWVAFFKVLFDAEFAGRVYAAPAALPPPEPEPKRDTGPALQLLALLQREGRFVDFLEEDVASFSDADIGAAARIVHDGCRKALREHVTLEPIRKEEEGAKVTLEAGFPASEVKLTGNVQGEGPYTGVLRHRGWRAKEIKLPEVVAGHDARVIAQAEVEL